jgi:hypothetical protein
MWCGPAGDPGLTITAPDFIPPYGTGTDAGTGTLLLLLLLLLALVLVVPVPVPLLTEKMQGPCLVQFVLEACTLMLKLTATVW